MSDAATNEPTVEVHVYRNRGDDERIASELHYCAACGGWYGVPHNMGHCQKGRTAKWGPGGCACRFCCEATGRPVTGRFGFITREKRWQP